MQLLQCASVSYSINGRAERTVTAGIRGQRIRGVTFDESHGYVSAAARPLPQGSVLHAVARRRAKTTSANSDY